MKTDQRERLVLLLQQMKEVARRTQPGPEETRRWREVAALTARLDCTPDDRSPEQWIEVAEKDACGDTLPGKPGEVAR